jgi:hypothetical protein
MLRVEGRHRGAGRDVDIRSTARSSAFSRHLAINRSWSFLNFLPSARIFHLVPASVIRRLRPQACKFPGASATFVKVRTWRHSRQPSSATNNRAKRCVIECGRPAFAGVEIKLAPREILSRARVENDTDAVGKLLRGSILESWPKCRRLRDNTDTWIDSPPVLPGRTNSPLFNPLSNHVAVATFLLLPRSLPAFRSPGINRNVFREESIEPRRSNKFGFEGFKFSLPAVGDKSSSSCLIKAPSPASVRASERSRLHKPLIN